MCLGIPGRLASITDDGPMRTGKVDFGGILKEVCLAYVPEAEVGQYVIVHVGFAISVIDEDEAKEIFDALAQMGELEDIAAPQPGLGAAPPAPLFKEEASA